MEKVQKRANRTYPSLQGLSYLNRLHNLGLSTLERRWERGDMTKTDIYKIHWFATPTERKAVDIERNLKK